MDKILANGKCKLANQAFATYFEQIYGIRCTENNNEWLHLFLWAYESGCITTDTDCNHCTCSDCSECLHCNIQANIGKIIKYCKDCKPKKYMTPIVTPNDDYTEWYESQEYLDCLQIELEENGWIEPMIDLCKNLHIDITAEQACKLVAAELAVQQVDCTMLTNIIVTHACNVVVDNIVAENLCKDFDTDIE